MGEAEKQEAVRALKAKHVTILEPGQPMYRKAIATSNLLFRFSRPEFVARPTEEAHVQAIIREAKKNKLQVTIKGNGHSYAGHSTAFGGISLDLREMNKVTLDMNSMTVTMDAGCQWGHVYEKLVSGRHDGYIINGGRCPTVGVSGFILGGGLSPFTRSFGMGCDTLMEATVVTAKGDSVTVKNTDDKMSDNGRLFWALRGAGGGNFGVLIRMKLKVQKLSNRYDMVVAGRYQWFPQGGFTDNVMDTMNDFYVTKWPNKVTIDTTWICDLRQQNVLGGVRFTVSFDGSKDEYDRLIDKHIKNEDLKTPLKQRVLGEKSTRFLFETLASQWLEETERAYPSNKTYELYSSFIFKNDDRNTIETATATIRELMATFRKDFHGEQVNFLVTWIHAGGKATETAPADSAFFWREAVFHTYVTVEWIDKWMERDMRRFLAKVKRALRPLSLKGEAAFINFPDRDFPTKVHESAYFGGNRDELRRVKEIWDPENFFKCPQGVRRPNDPEEDEDDIEDEDKTDQLASKQWSEEWGRYQPKDLSAALNEFADLGYDEMSD
ncbi:hypothetical protein Neosp_004417 [[Neocosmospora] mangrovei]